MEPEYLSWMRENMPEDLYLDFQRSRQKVNEYHQANYQQLRDLLRKTHTAWITEANWGDGIAEEHDEIDREVRAVLKGDSNGGRMDFNYRKTTRL